MASKAAAEVAKMKLLEERIRAPTVWKYLSFGLRVEDLQEKRFDEAVKFVKHHYLDEEGLYKSVKILDDPEATEEFLYNFRIWLKDKTSLALIKEKKDRLVGLIVARIQDKASFSRTFSRVKLTRTGPYTDVMKFLNQVEKPVNLFKQLKVNHYLKIYVIGVLPRYRNRGVTRELLLGLISMATRLKIPAISALLTTRKIRDIAHEFEFEEYNEIYYVRYQINDKVIFNDMGERNYGCALAGYRIPEVEVEFEESEEESEDLPIQRSPSVSLSRSRVLSRGSMKTPSEPSHSADGDAHAPLH